MTDNFSLSFPPLFEVGLVVGCGGYDGGGSGDGVCGYRGEVVVVGGSVYVRECSSISPGHFLT